MIKLVYVLARREDVTAPQFYDYWLNTHGPKVRERAQAIRARKYIQSHLIDSDLSEAFRAPRGMLRPAAGITEVWWDSLDDFKRGFESAEGARAAMELAEDEAHFIDFRNSSIFLTEEHLIFDWTDRHPLGPDAAKITYLLQGKAGMTDAEVHRTWHDDHGRLVRGLSEKVNMRKYIQSHTVEPDYARAVFSTRGVQAPLTGITEVWVDSPASLESGFDTAEGRQIGEVLIEDERRFIDLSRSRCFLSKEHVIFDHLAADARESA